MDFSKLFDKKIDAYVVLGDSNRFYFSQFECSFGAAIITKTAKILIVDSRYELAAKEQVKDFEIEVTTYSELFERIKNNLIKLGVQTVGYESSMSISDFNALKGVLKDFKLKSATELLQAQRAVKTAREIELIAHSQQIAERALQKVVSKLKVGMTEREVMASINYEMILGGADKYSFETIVAFGANSAMPHHEPDDTKLEKNDIVLVDMGAKTSGYCSDMTRTFCFGDEPKAPLAEIYDIVKEAQEYALKYIRPGMTGHEADSLAREIITANGYGREFSHSLGHGVGVDIHEFPRLGLGSNDILEENMIVTVEPGIYIEGVGGIRIEDFVVIQKDGVLNLTNYEKKFIL